MQQKAYSIGEAADASGVSVKAIRYYEEIGLIPRARRRANGGLGDSHRVFTDADVGRLRFIHHARALDLGLREIHELVVIAEEKGCPGDKPEYRGVLARHLKSINERIERLVQLLGTLENLMNASQSNATGQCTWETCDCMDAVPAALADDVRGSRKSRSHRKKGGSHV